MQANGSFWETVDSTILKTRDDCKCVCFILPPDISFALKLLDRYQKADKTLSYRYIVTFLGRFKEFPTRQIEEKTFLFKYSQKKVKDLWYLYCEVFTGNETLPHRLPLWDILSAFSVKVSLQRAGAFTL